MCRISFLLLFALSMFWAEAQNEIQYKITVAKDGSGNYTSIQDAIDATKAFPDQRITIFIKNGIYNEKLCVPSCNNKLSLIGEDVEKTIITFDDYFYKINRGRNSTFYTWTLKIEADDFYAENLTIQNTAGEVGQAVALHVEGDRCVFKNCKLLGNQDTLYLNGEKSHQFFTNCTIDGTTDFIFGAATAVFESCTIRSKKDSYITAASTTKGQKFGFVFINCKLKATDGVSKVYLGRPWRPNAKTVFMKCDLGEHIHPAGWKEWSNKNNLTATFYAEYENTGLGAETAKRIGWTSILNKREAKHYTLKNILGNWILQYSRE